MSLRLLFPWTDIQEDTVLTNMSPELELVFWISPSFSESQEDRNENYPMS